MLKELILATDIHCNIRAYGLFHIAFFLCGLIVCYCVSFLFKKNNNKQNNKLLLCLGILLMLMEVYKQLYFYYKYGTYQWNIFPFQLCSIPMYLCIICFFLKSQIIKNTMYYFMSTYTLMSGFVSFIEPSGLIHENLYLTLHSFLWHMILVFIGVYLIISKRIVYKTYNFLLATIFFLFLCNIAYLINITFMELSNHSINMFFIGPNINNLIVFKQIGEATSWVVSTILYIPSVIFASYLVSKLVNRFIEE